MILQAKLTNDGNFPRWMIVNEDDRCWTGNEWSDDEDRALLYSAPNQVATEIQHLTKQEFSDKERACFQIPIVLEVFADEEIDMESLARWCSETAQLYMNSTRNGNGPVPNSLVLTRILWSHIKRATVDVRTTTDPVDGSSIDEYHIQS